MSISNRVRVGLQIFLFEIDSRGAGGRRRLLVASLAAQIRDRGSRSSGTAGSSDEAGQNRGPGRDDRQQAAA